MKRKNTKNDFKKFTKRNTHKRRDKEKGKRELLKIIGELGVKTDGAKILMSEDKSTRGKKSSSRHSDRECIGVFSSSKSGFGFVTPQNPEDYPKDIFIPEGKTNGAIDGDLVEIVFHTFDSHFEEKTEGRVTKIISYGRKTVIGKVAYKRSFGHRKDEYVLLPDNDKISICPTLTELSGANVSDKVEAEIIRDKLHPTSQIKCRVIRNFGPAYSKEANYEAVLAECDIETDFTKEELYEADFFASLPITKEGRVDRTRDVIFTIDGADAKDLDDAVSLRRLPDGYQLGVHIADVSYYIKERTHLDRAVMSRGTSVYFVDKVVPMLPPQISNGACSLSSGEEKYTLSAIINLDKSGNIRSVKIEPSVIKSRVRGVYSEVNEIFSGAADRQIKNKYKEVIPTLLKMKELYEVLLKNSTERGAIDFEAAEAKIILDPLGAPVDIIKRERGISERIIEQFMITANVAVASLLYDKKIPCVYRVHEPPTEDKLAAFLEFIHNLGFDTKIISKNKKDAADFASLLKEAQNREILSPVSYVMLRSMSKAKYSEVCTGHFGLSLMRYCHFTSPIRRLSDLATHRIIRGVLLSDKRPEQYLSYARRAAAAATDAEIRAVSAERKIENLYKVIYMEEFIGREFDAVISSVGSFGFFVELDNTVEGLVPISTLGNHFIFEEKNYVLRSGVTYYRLGDKVRVVLEEADIVHGKLRFSVL